MKRKNKKLEAQNKTSQILPTAIILADLLNPGTPWRD
jgi:hypothetical protein